MTARAGAGDMSELPVFVVGMPRSGTSLVEQIIASHPQAFGAGEWRDFQLLIGKNLLGEALLEVRYEELVGDFEPQVRRILDFCDLEWDERCLSFHRTERVVHTVSATQVRQPLYRTAIGRAGPYRKWLTALTQALGEATA